MYLLIPAAGMGRRMGSSRNKLLLTLLDKALIAWTLMAANASRHIHWIGLISHPDDWADFKEILTSLTLTKSVHLISGGVTRQESVYNGLQFLPADAQHVLIHDGARCLVTSDLFDRCATAILHCSGLTTAIPVKDTIKVVNSQTRAIASTPERRQLWAAQTPQGFEVELLKKCHMEAHHQGWEVTDDSTLFEKCNLPVQIVEGEETNFKITTHIDLMVAEFILQQRLVKQREQQFNQRSIFILK